jgi:plasmid maintenance system antidote protein VapI
MPPKRFNPVLFAIGNSLARHFGTTADLWMNLQKDYELL